MGCPKCGNKNPEEAVYCANCGSLLRENVKTASPKKSSNFLITIGCLVFFIFGLLVLAGVGGGYYYFYFCKKQLSQKSVQKKTATTSTPSQTVEVGGIEELAESSVKETVENFYNALLEGKYEKAGNFVTARAKKDWYLPEIQDQGDTQLTNFQILSISFTGEDEYLVKVKETYEDFEGRFYETLSYTVLKKGSEWLIDDLEFIEESFDFAPDLAINTVGEFLNALRERRMNEARGMVTENFINEVGEDFFINSGQNIFQQFEILKTKKIGNYYWVYTREIWNSGVEKMKYKVVATEGGLFIDSMTWVE
jgi:hypothetical protein